MLIQLFNDILTISIKSIPFIILLIFITVLFQRKLHPLVIEVIWLMVFIRLIIPKALPLEIDFLSLNNRDDKVVLVESFSDYYVEDRTRPLELISSDKADFSNYDLRDRESKISYKYIFSIIWIIISLGIFSFTWIKTLQFSKKLKKSGIKRLENEGLPLVETEYINFPIIYGCFRPVIYIPVKLWKILNSKEKGYVLFHENQHFRRKDILTGWIYFLILSIHWFNPFVWLSYIFIQGLKEISCDRQVLNKLSKKNHISYAKTLLKVGELCNSNYSNASIASFAGKSTIKRRIEMIISKRKLKMKWILVTATLMIIVALTFITDPFALGYYKPKVVREWTHVKTYYRTDYPLKKDKDLIGTWLSIGSAKDIDSFDQSLAESLKSSGEYYMVVKSDGTTSEALSWTRGIFIHKKYSFTLEYKIKDLDGIKYLFLERLGSPGKKSLSYSVFVKYSNNEYKEDLYVPPTVNSNIEVQLPQGTIDKDMSISDVIDILGSPLNYYSDNRYFGPSDLNIEDLPNNFAMDYGRYEIYFIHGHLELLHIYDKEINYNELSVGDSLDEVFTKISKPLEIVESQNPEFKDYILYKTAFRENFYHYYMSPKDSMVLNFRNGNLEKIIVDFTLN